MKLQDLIVNFTKSNKKVILITKKGYVLLTSTLCELWHIVGYALLETMVIKWNNEDPDIMVIYIEL